MDGEVGLVRVRKLELHLKAKTAPHAGFFETGGTENSRLETGYSPGESDSGSTQGGTAKAFASSSLPGS